MNSALVLAVGVAVSPIPVAVVTLILSGGRPRLGSAFALGWIAGVTGSLAVLVALVSVADTSDETPLWISLAELGLGLVFLGLAAHVWRSRHRPRPAGAPPRWLTALDRLTPMRSAGLGLLLSAANPKNLALALAAAISIAAANESSAATAVTVILFASVGTVGVAVPLAVSAAAPERSRSALSTFRDWLLHHDAAVLTVLGIVVGAKLCYDGVTAL
ncbi:MAG TPA: GAP family protein [Gaiellaceae bacterium]|nr:GAP family protein [Gaiellaceae bacterium]